MTSGGPASAAELRVEDQRFSIVPEWVIDAPGIGDTAFRLYAVLLRYGQTSGQRMPSRATLARRLHKRSVDTVDRALRELVAAGAVEVERRKDGRRNLTNRYLVRTTQPGCPTTSGRSRAATPARNIAATLAAAPRPDPEPFTESTSLPLEPASGERVRELRRGLGLPVGRWSDDAIRRAVARACGRGWPESEVEAALFVVAADPRSLSPARVAEAGPWWDRQRAAPTEDLAGLEAELDELDGRRLLVQRLAREELQAEGIPLSRTTVVRRAVEISRRKAL